MARIIFVTGTDTGVGKTVLTGLLLVHLRIQGKRALALKPFSSGDRGDAVLLHALQQKDLSLNEINPFHFAKPVAPFLAASARTKRKITLPVTVAHIERVAAKCDWLLVEGAGGLLVPLGDGWSVLDLICALGCQVMVVGRNALGTINHTCLTAKCLQERGLQQAHFVLMQAAKSDFSARSNPVFLRAALAPCSVSVLPFLGMHASQAGAIQAGATKLKKMLARLLQ